LTAPTLFPILLLEDCTVVFSRSRLFCSVLVAFGQGSFIDRSDPVSDIVVFYFFKKWL